MHTLSVYTLLITVLLVAPSHAAPVAIRENNDSLSGPVTVVTTSTTQTPMGNMLETCQITLTPIVTNGQALVQEVKECALTTADGKAGNGGSPVNAGQDPSTTTSSDSSSSSSTSTSDSSSSTSTSSSDSSSTTSSSRTRKSTSTSSSSPSSSPSPSPSSSSSSSSSSSGSSSATATALGTAAPPVRTKGFTTIPRPTSSLPPSSTGSASSGAATSTGSVLSTSVSTSTGSSSSPTGSATSSGSITQTASSNSSGTVSASSSIPMSSGGASGVVAEAQASPTASTAFVMPGQSMSVLPIGLGVFAGITVIALIVVGLVTYERTKYRKAFRERKLAEQGGA